ncbi:hypothetical protein [Moritella sp. F3]|uniref:hypothetical protein n=1 Tax=Moritella sp. F3 TaxID=2718882 RepID=UPI0018E134DB|nr:hypothetical protein [Moritella sp. F3]GIC77163.1 hypothetical protein FMO001_18900 [Moritella sp. F1]GIC82282.1 hypothetical protein FMO003_25630 [Moritella sp. F3]
MKYINQNRSTDLNSLLSEIKAILGIKLSRAKERHATAMGLNSYNHLIGKIKREGEVSTELSSYIDLAKNQMFSVHDVSLTEEQIISLTIVLGKHSRAAPTQGAEPTFMDYLKFSLFNSAQSNPYLLFTFSQLNLIENEATHNKWITDYIDTGNIDPKLIASIKVAIKTLRKAMVKSLLSGGYDSRYAAVSELKDYRAATTKSGENHLINTYYFPITTIANAHDPISICVTKKGLCDAAKISSDLPMSTCSKATDLRDLFFNSVIPQEFYFEEYESISEHSGPHLFLDNNADLFTDDDADESEEEVVFWCELLKPQASHPSVNLFHSNFHNVEYDINIINNTPTKYEQLLIPKSVFNEFDFDLFVTLNNDKSYNLERAPFNCHEFTLEEDFCDRDYVNVSVIPITTVGYALSKDQLSAIQEYLNKSIQSPCKKDYYSVVSEALVSPTHSSDNESCSTSSSIYNKSLAKLLHDNPDISISIANNKNALYYTVSSASLKSDYGCEYSPISTTEYGLTNYDFDHNEFAQLALITPLFNELRAQNESIKAMDCYYDNLRKKEIIIAGDHAPFHFETTAHASSFEELMAAIRIEQCNNIYLIIEDRESSDDAIYLVGFNHSGEQVFNLTYFFLLQFMFGLENYHLGKFIEDVRELIEGGLFCYEDEITSYALSEILENGEDDDLITQETHGLDMFMNETEFVNEYFSSYKNNEPCHDAIILSVEGECNGDVLNILKNQVRFSKIGLNCETEIEQIYQITPLPVSDSIPSEIEKGTNLFVGKYVGTTRYADIAIRAKNFITEELLPEKEGDVFKITTYRGSGVSSHVTLTGVCGSRK